VVAGTSIGALVGGVYAAGIPVDRIKREWLEADLLRVVRAFLPTFPRAGLSSGRELEKYIRSLVGDVRFEDLPIPFAAVACDLNTGEPVVIRQGVLAKGIRASASIPGIFHPVRWDGQFLVDGGLVDPLPVRVCRDLGADIVIGVDIVPAPYPVAPSRTAPPRRSAKGVSGDTRGQPSSLENLVALLGEGVPVEHSDESPLPGVYTTLNQAVAILEQGVLRLEMNLWPADLLVHPDLPRSVSYFKASDGILAGERAMEAALPKLHVMLQTMQDERQSEGVA